VAAPPHQLARIRNRHSAWRRAGYIALAIMGLGGPSLIAFNREMDRRQCRNQMRSLWMAARLHANEQDGRLPASMEEFRHAQTLPISIMECRKGGSYIYCLSGSPSLASLTPHHVVIMDGSSNHWGGRNVLYGDGSVHWVSNATGHIILDSLKAGANPPVIGINP
jgi:prepilin-type processing-associated H-X9-DG protein